MKKLFLVVNVDWFFLSHRLPIALEAIKRGYEVTLITRDTGRRGEIESRGIRFIDISFERANVNLIKEYGIYRELSKLYQLEKPDIVHHITLKPIILGTLAARKNKEISVINAVSGLGVLFTEEGNKLKRFFTVIILKFIFSIKNNLKIVFQNKDDKRTFIKTNIIDEKYTIIIKGSGIDLNAFSFRALASGNTQKVLIAARMLYPKGFDEFSQAAALIKNSSNYPNVEFEMAGDLDLQNPLGIPEHVIRIWEKDRHVKWLGHVADMKSLIANADIIVFPSYYGEGIPKFLIEACAIGRPIVTTDSVGCRECVIDGENGFLVPVKNVDILANRILQLLNNTELRERMGIKSRKHAENEFAINSVLNKTFALYENINCN